MSNFRESQPWKGMQLVRNIMIWSKRSKKTRRYTSLLNQQLLPRNLVVRHQMTLCTMFFSWNYVLCCSLHVDEVMIFWCLGVLKSTEKVLNFGYVITVGTLPHPVFIYSCCSLHACSQMFSYGLVGAGFCKLYACMINQPSTLSET